MTGGRKGRRWLPYVLAAAAALMAALVYLNALDNPFVYDDHRVILENYSIRDLSNIRALFLNDVFRPVVNISYAIDYAWSGLRPFGYHVTSVLLHMANVVMLFALVRVLAGDVRSMRLRSTPVAAPAQPVKKKGGSRAAALDPTAESGDVATTAAFAAAAIWAVHPLTTQAVGYVSGRSELLCAFFVLVAFLCLHAWVFRRGTAWLMLGLGAWFLALASKEAAVMLPVVFWAYGRLLLPAADDTRRRVGRVCIPMLAFVAVASAVRMLVFAGLENVSRASFAWSNLPVGLDVIRQYFWLVFLAAPQAIFHSAQVPPSALSRSVILDVLWIAGLAILAWRVHRRMPIVAFGVVWFILMLLPSVAMLVLDVGELMAEQRVYLAGCGFALAMGAAFGWLFDQSSSRAWTWRGVVVAALACLLFVMAGRTFARNQVWGDPVRLWKEAVANAPDVWLPHRGLGDALREKGDYAGAAAAYAEAARLRPQEAGTHLALGITLLMAGRLDAADIALAEATRLSPGMAEAETARGMIARALGRRDEARDRFLAVARAHPDAVIARQYLAEMYEKDYADPASALRMCREVQALAPQAQGVAECIQRNERRLAESGASMEKR